MAEDTSSQPDEPQSQPAAAPQGPKAADSGAPASGSQPFQDAPSQGASAEGAPAAAPSVPQPPAAAPKPVYAKSCLAAALDDVRATPNWVQRTLVLGLVGCVPILNFTVDGYCLNWSREVPFGGRTTMPKEIVTGRNFEVGFYAFLISLVVGIVLGIVSAVVGWIPLIGWIVSVAASLFGCMLSTLCCVRMALSKQLGEGFRVGRAWEALRQNWTGLLGASVVPGLLAGCVGCAVGAVLLALVLMMSLPAFMAVAASSSLAAPVAVVSTLASLGVGGGLLLLAFYVFMSILSAFAMVVAYRAVAHYVGRYAPGWAEEAKVAMGYVR